MAVGLGFLLGMRHAADPDHLVAISTLAAGSRRLASSWLLGMLWGLGHTLTVLAVGSVIVLLRLRVPPRFETATESLVGGCLVLLGLLNLAGLKLLHPHLTEHAHEHEHDPGHEHDGAHADPADSGAHSHSHLHLGYLERLAQEVGAAQIWKSLGIGMVHGLAGTTAVALLVLATIPSPLGGVAYLAVFSLGIMGGMLGLTLLLGGALARLRGDALEKWLAPGTGILSILYGLYIMYKQMATSAI